MDFQNHIQPAKGVLLILSAPSGAGKTTLARRLGEELGDGGLFSVSYTTRAPRGAEKDGVDYHFVDEASFKGMIERGEFLEWACVHGNYYGTHCSYAASADDHAAVIFDIDVQGGGQIKAKHPEAVSVFIMPPSMAELERRLRGRGTDAEDVIRKRLDAASAEIEKGLSSYDYVVVNDDLDRAYSDLSAIVRAARCRRR